MMKGKLWVLLSPGAFWCYYNIHKDKFRFYCEVVITRDGNICLPIQCGHVQILRDLCKEIDPNTEADIRSGLYELLTATRAITVSYMNQIMVEDFYSMEQKYAYDFLASLNLIQKNMFISKPYYLKDLEEV